MLTLSSFSQSGKYLMEDLHKIGGLPPVLRYLLDNGMLHGDTMTCTGQTLQEQLAGVTLLSFEDQDIIRPLENPIKATGHLTVMRGTLCPGSAVSKLTGKEGLFFEGPARVYDEESEVMEAIKNGEITHGNVVVVRYCGPRGAPGMPEMLSPTAAIMGAGLGKTTALITDGRFSGG